MVLLELQAAWPEELAGQQMEMWRNTRQFQLGALRFILQLVCTALKSEMLALSSPNLPHPGVRMLACL